MSLKRQVGPSGDSAVDQMLAYLLGRYHHAAAVCRDSQVTYLRRELAAAVGDGGEAYRVFAQQLSTYGLQP